MRNHFDHDQPTGKVVELSLSKLKDLSLNSKDQASLLRHLHKYQTMSKPPDDFSISLKSIISILSYDQNMQSQPQKTVPLGPKEIPKTKRQLIRHQLKMAYNRLGEEMLKIKRKEYQATINNILLKHKLEELTQQRQLPLPRQQLDPLLNSHRDIYEKQLRYKLAKYQNHQKMLQQHLTTLKKTHYRQ